MSEEEKPNPLKTKKVILDDGTEFSVFVTMIPKAERFVVGCKNMNIGERQDPLYVRYHHRLGNAASKLVSRALTDTPEEQKLFMQQHMDNLVEQDPAIKPLLEELGVEFPEE